jgi:hypothetical protein
MHWINVVVVVLFMSGLQIFNAYPALNFGKSSYNGRPPVLEIGARTDANGALSGVTRIGGAEFDTTGWLGATHAADGSLVPSTFPHWMMLPGPQWLSMARCGTSPVPAQRARLRRVCGREPPPHARFGTHRPELRASAPGAHHLRFRHPQGRRRSATTCCRSSRTSS